MFNSSRSPARRQHSGGWRDYQASLPRRTSRKPRPGGSRRRRRRILLAALLLAALVGLGRWPGQEAAAPAATVATATPKTPAPSLPPAAPPPPAAPAAIAAPAEASTPAAPALVALPSGEAPLDRAQLRQLLDARAFSQLQARELTLPTAAGPCRVETTLDPGLQGLLLNGIDRVNSRYVGIVVMEAASGRVLALAGFDRTDPEGNPCLQSQFPAASIFKMVTAAAAVDRLGYGVDTPVSFSGGKHTLYKQQLTGKVQRSDTTLPLGEAFAESINPVFGKLGSLRLGKTQLEQAAADFGFNQPLDFELPLPPSQFRIGEEPYNWAEVASGFNLETTLSPLHGAVLAATMLNGGRMPTPVLVERLADAQGRELYHRPAPAPGPPVISPRAARALVQMMETTVDAGTARKAFRNYRKDPVLSALEIGGKTGSIQNASHDLRFDWFVGFARPPQGNDALVVAAMVAHQEFIGTRAAEYARRAFSHYFDRSAAAR